MTHARTWVGDLRATYRRVAPVTICAGIEARGLPWRLRAQRRRLRAARAGSPGLFRETRPRAHMPRPGPSRRPCWSCTSGTAPTCSRCRTGHRQRRAGRRDQWSGRRLRGRGGRSPGTSCHARRARRGARERTGVATSACCSRRCAGCGWTARVRGVRARDVAVRLGRVSTPGRNVLSFGPASTSPDLDSGPTS